MSDRVKAARAAGATEDEIDAIREAETAVKDSGGDAGLDLAAADTSADAAAKKAAEEKAAADKAAADKLAAEEQKAAEEKAAAEKKAADEKAAEEAELRAAEEDDERVERERQRELDEERVKRLIAEAEARKAREAAPAAPVFDLRGKRKALNELISTGGDAAQIDQLQAEIDEHMMAKARADAKAEAERAADEKLRIERAQLQQEQLDEMAANVIKDYPFLNSKSREHDAIAIRAVLGLRNTYVAEGMKPHLALRKAADDLGPKFKPVVAAPAAPPAPTKPAAAAATPPPPAPTTLAKLPAAASAPVEDELYNRLVQLDGEELEREVARLNQKDRERVMRRMS